MKTFFLKVITIFLVSMLGFLSCTKHKVKDKKIYIIFRFDDPSAYTSDVIESKILHIFKDHNLSLTFAVIPYRCAGDPIDVKPQKVVPLTQKKANLFQPFVQKGTLEIALHGYSHQTRSNEKWTEFAGMPYAEQLDKLTKGKKLLETLFTQRITSFVPPYNAYDINTTKVLKSLQFLTISADEEGIKPKNFGLKFISNTVTLDKVQQAIDDAMSEEEKRSFIVVMFHEYNFMNIKMPGVDKPEMSFEGLDELLTNLQHQKNIHILSLKQASKIYPNP
ncbi:MAG: hypothetical protein DSZ12_05160 [Sulfurovum sp.]|nr:MAG: hypothetical protein DSZ12_05160 [Sulfurovum sp.]